MTTLSEKMAFRISDSELERRWSAIRGEMERRDIDVLVMQNSNEFNGGYVRWFTDVAARHGGPMTVIFPRNAGMAVITSGGRDGRVVPPKDGTGLFRGVDLVLTSPYTTAEWTTDDVDGKLAVSALAEIPHKRIGWVGMGAIRMSFGDYVRRALPACEFINASDLVDVEKAFKSEEEIGLIRRSAALQDQVWAGVLSSIKPGMRELEIAADAFRHAQVLGSTDGLILTGSAPIGEPGVKGHRHFQNRVLKAGDQFTMLIEVNGPGGYYTELGRTCVLGKATTEIKEEFQIAREAQAETVKRLKPGCTPVEIWDAHNAFMRAKNRPEERRLFCHGQGYDLVERPALRDGDSMQLRASMNIVVHPTFTTGRVYSWICDNYLLGAETVERLHRTEQVIFEVS